MTNDALARLLCDDHDARTLAGREFAPSYDDSAPDVQRYWDRIAEVAQSQSSIRMREALEKIRDESDFGWQARNIAREALANPRLDQPLPDEQASR